MGGEGGLVWEWAWLPDQEQVGLLSAEQKQILYGPQTAARAFAHIQIRGTQFRTYSTEVANKYKTQDSGVAVMQMGVLKYGRLISVWQVSYGAKKLILLTLDIFSKCSDDARFKGGIKVTCNASRGQATYRTVVSPSEIKQQVFFATDPDNDSCLHVFKLLSSAYTLPAAMADQEGNFQL